MRPAEIPTLIPSARLVCAGTNRPLAGVTADSRKVRADWLFAALPGVRVDGSAFIAAAVAAGATAVLGPPDLPPPPAGVALLTDPDPARAFARLAAALAGGQPATIVAVTGTNGKTSTVTFTRQLWAGLGYAAASLGTLGLQAPGRDRPGQLTTPDPAALHAILADLAATGVDHLAMEASSHGLAQRRLDGVRLAAGAFTNLTRDHLDHHGTMEAYLAAKARLFDSLLPAGGGAVVVIDDPAGRTLADAAAARGLRVLTCGQDPAADLRLCHRAPLADGQGLALALFGRPVTVTLPLAGAFQAMNALVALGLVLAAEGITTAAAAQDQAPVMEALIAGLGRLTGVPGRLERVARTPRGAPVFVDYAHTPDALETVLAALRPHCRGRLVVVFGCGGDRDPGKRPQMGAIAARGADRVIVTDDNPRSESPALIRAQIRATCPGAADIGDRAAAIRAALADLAEDDVLVIAGKGHETGQTVGGITRPFQDAAEVRAAITEQAAAASSDTTAAAAPAAPTTTAPGMAAPGGPLSPQTRGRRP